MAEQVHLASTTSLYGKMLLYVLDELIAMTSDDQLGLSEVVAFKDRFSDAASMIVVDCIDGIVEDDDRALHGFCLSHEDRQPKAANMAFAKYVKCIDPSARIPLEANLNLPITTQWKMQRR